MRPLIWLGERRLGVMGELHPLVQRALRAARVRPLLAADLDLEAHAARLIPERYTVRAGAGLTRRCWKTWQ